MSSYVYIVISIPTEEKERANKSIPPSAQFKSVKSNLQVTLEQLNIKDATWQLNTSNNLWRVIFTCELGDSDGILEFLARKCKIGTLKDTYVGIIPFSFFMTDEFIQNEVFDDDDATDESDEEFYYYSGKKETNISKDEPVKCLSIKKNQRQFRKDESMKNHRREAQNDFKNFQEKFLKSITARLTVAQVTASVKSAAELTFDFLLYVITAAMIAAMGLMENSIVSLVASMLVSPMMGPVMAMTFGTIVRNREIRNLGIRNAAIGFFICILFGFIFGCIVLIFLNEWNSEMVFPTAEMRGRGELRVLWVGALVAAPSGVAVALSILSGAQASLIGVAISASLLPPCVNAGILWSYSILQLIHPHSQNKVMMMSGGEWTTIKEESLVPHTNYQAIYYPDNISLECFILGLVSLGLTAVNVTSIFFAAYVFLKIKEITPETALSPSTARFFKEDLKIARRYNDQSNDGMSPASNLTGGSGNNNYSPLDDSSCSLGVQILREWIAANGLNESKFFADDSPAARESQSQTLRDMLADVKADRVYRAITRASNQLTEVCPEDLVVTFRESSESPRQSVLLASKSKVRRNTTIGAIGSMPRASVYTVDMEKGNQEKDTSGVSAQGSTSSNVITSGPDSIHLRQRRKSSILLRRSLMNTEHSPLSVWPKARRSDTDFWPGNSSTNNQQ